MNKKYISNKIIVFLLILTFSTVTFSSCLRNKKEYMTVVELNGKQIRVEKDDYIWKTLNGPERKSSDQFTDDNSIRVLSFINGSYMQHADYYVDSNNLYRKKDSVYRSLDQELYMKLMNEFKKKNSFYEIMGIGKGSTVFNSDTNNGLRVKIEYEVMENNLFSIFNGISLVSDFDLANEFDENDYVVISTPTDVFNNSNYIYEIDKNNNVRFKSHNYEMKNLKFYDIDKKTNSDKDIYNLVKNILKK